MDHKTNQSVARIINYFIQAEKKHWAESGQPDDHIYRDAIRLEEWLISQRSDSGLQPEPDGKTEYAVTLTITGNRIDQVKKRLARLFPECEVEVEKIETQSRVRRLADAQSIVEELQSEIQDWRDNLPENLQSGTKAEELDECISSLDDLLQAFESVEFPSAF